MSFVNFAACHSQEEGSHREDMSNLQFQSFTNQNFDMSDESPGGGGGNIGDHPFIEEDNTATTGPKRNFFTFAYFQQYFDVDTEQVSKRIVNSVIPTHKNYITEFVQPLPDLYGPFWVCVTLVFSIGIFSNIAQYIESQGASGDYGSDFRMVTGASSLIASYVLIVPFIISTTLWYRKAEIQYSYLEVLCAYGYSLSIFIPVSMLWVIDSGLLRWSLIFVSVTLSGGVLVRSLWPAFQRDANKMLAIGAIAAVIFLHFGLALCFKEYFFDAAMPSRPSVGPPVAPPTPVIDALVNGSKPGASAVLSLTTPFAKKTDESKATVVPIVPPVAGINATTQTTIVPVGKVTVDEKKEGTEAKKGNETTTAPPKAVVSEVPKKEPAVATQGKEATTVKADSKAMVADKGTVDERKDNGTVVSDVQNATVSA